VKSIKELLADSAIRCLKGMERRISYAMLAGTKREKGRDLIGGLRGNDN